MGCDIKGVMIFLVLTLALLIDLFLGEPPSLLHPTVWMGKHIAFIRSRTQILFSPSRKGMNFIMGVIIVISGIVIWGIPISRVEMLLHSREWLFVFVSAPLFKVSFSLRYLLYSGREIGDALEEHDLDRARHLTSWHLVSRNTDDLDEKEITSCVLESLSENITDSFSSPLFYYLAGGLPAAWCYRFINTSDAMVAYRTEELEWLGKFTAWCDSLLNLIPARLTALTICIAAQLCPGASGRQAWRVMLRDRKQTASPNAGWTMAAMAGALSSRLEKKGVYVLGGGMELPTPDKINLCLKVTTIALILTFLLLITLYGGVLWAVNMAA